MCDRYTLTRTNLGEVVNEFHAELDPSVEHQPHVDQGGECICLIASERPMKVTTLVGRIVNLMTGV